MNNNGYRSIGCERQREYRWRCDWYVIEDDEKGIEKPRKKLKTCIYKCARKSERNTARRTTDQTGPRASADHTHRQETQSQARFELKIEGLQVLQSLCNLLRFVGEDATDGRGPEDVAEEEASNLRLFPPEE